MGRETEVASQKVWMGPAPAETKVAREVGHASRIGQSGGESVLAGQAIINPVWTGFVVWRGGLQGRFLQSVEKEVKTDQEMGPDFPQLGRRPGAVPGAHPNSE